MLCAVSLPVVVVADREKKKLGQLSPNSPTSPQTNTSKKAMILSTH